MELVTTAKANPKRILNKGIQHSVIFGFLQKNRSKDFQVKKKKKEHEPVST